VKTLREYSRALFLSVVSPRYFREVIQRSATSACGYFIFFTFLHGVAISVVGLWFINGHYDGTLSLLQRTVPNITARFSEGNFFISVPQPIALGDLNFSVVIDTTNRVSHLDSYKNGILLSKNYLLIKEEGTQKKISFDLMPDFSLRTPTMFSFLRIHKIAILTFLFVMSVVLVFPSFWLTLIFLIPPWALVLWLESYIFQRPLRYGQSLSVAFYATTLPTLAATLIYQKVLGTFWSFSIILLYLVWSSVGIFCCQKSSCSE